MLVEKPVNKFLDELASNSPAPGGGSAAALAGALGVALTSMVCNLTIGKKKYLEVEAEIKKVLNDSEKLRLQFTQLIEDDALAFNKVMKAYGLPKDTEEQKSCRTAAIQEATKEAALVPLEVVKYVSDALTLARVVAEKGNLNSISDAGVGALMLYTAAESAALNVKINLQGITDEEFVKRSSEDVDSLLQNSRMKVEEIMSIVRSKVVC